MKITDVDDDDEYMNAAAAHAAFVMTVSAARMYWLLRHALHSTRATSIFISSTHFPKTTGWALPIFCTVEHSKPLESNARKENYGPAVAVAMARTRRVT